MRPDHLQKWLEDQLKYADQASTLKPGMPVIGASRAVVERWAREDEAVKSVRTWLGSVRQYNQGAAASIRRIAGLMKEDGFDVDDEHFAFWPVLTDLVKAGIKAKPFG